MGTFKITGGKKLHGTITPQGAKNETLQILCAVLLTAEEVRITNIPDIVDINKLIDTYKNRTAEDKYSHVAQLTEVAENDYNLNIPRYVDTFEEEEPVDLATVSNALKAIDTDMATTDATIADYCQQLGIDTPF